MLFVDPRGGSCELVAPLRALGLDVDDSTYLPAGDIMFQGRGEGGKEVLVGIEYKKLPDFIASVRSERLQDIQLTGMTDAGYDNKWLFIEGELLYDERGRLQRRGRKQRLVPLEGGMGVGELFKRIYVFHLCGGLTPWWTTNQRDTVTSINMLYHTWNDRDLDEHRSHLGVYHAPTLVPISDFRSIVMLLPGVGFKAAIAAEREFGGNIHTAINAKAERWAEIQTIDKKGNKRRLGMVVAAKLVEWLRSNHA